MAGDDALPDDDDHDGDALPYAEEDDNGNDCQEHDGSPPQKRRVVDFDVDDPDWEDVDTLPGLGTTTHRTRNSQLPANTRRKQRRRVVAGPNARASAARRRGEGIKRLDALAADLDAWEVEREDRVHELAEKHGMKPKEVRRRMLALSTYGTRRRPSAYNAKISRIMADLNASRGLGERYTMPEVKRMVADDPSMLAGFSKEEEKEMVDAILAKRDAKRRGTRANNLAAAADAKRTMDRLMVEITSLAERVGMIGFAMFSRSHIHDKTVPVTIQSWGALDFFREVLKRDPADVSHLLELWAVSRERGKSLKNKLLEKQQKATGIITTGLQTVLGVTKCAMNYENYVEKLVRGKGVGLVNWPHGVDFKCMSLQSAIGPLDKLLDSLECGTTRWKVLTAAEKKQLIEQHEDMVERGEVKEKKKSGRSRKAKSRKAGKGPRVEDDDEEEGDNDDEPPTRKAATRSKRPAHPRAHDYDSDDEDHDDDAAPARKRVKNRQRNDDEDEDPPARKATKKRQRDNDVDDDPPARKATKKRQRDSDVDDDPPARKAPAKRRRPAHSSVRDEESADDDDADEPPARKTAAKTKRPAHPPARDHDSGSDEDDNPPARKVAKKHARSTARSSAPARSKSSGSQKGAKSKPTTVQGRLRALVQKGLKANDEAARLRKRGMSENEGERGEPADNARRARPKPKPLYRTKTTTAPAAVSSDEGDDAARADGASGERREPPPRPYLHERRVATTRPCLHKRRVDAVCRVAPLYHRKRPPKYLARESESWTTGN
ncbi:hypothetical protein B0H14DRAFT_3447879 [Mycena olivaceomarginata]|nr:hypothetical protein B0H14DRAFT_3447879 [Mycena olivaceomarginata]